MAKIILIEPRAPNLHIFTQFYTPRLGILVLGTIMKQRGWEVRVIIEEQEAIDYRQVVSADLVGISTITSTAPRAYAIADKIRQQGVPVIMGGPHVTYLPEEALEHADFIIRGEGELALPALVDAWQNGRGYAAVPNLSYWRNNRMLHNPLKPFLTDLDQIPAPDFSLLKKAVRGVAGKNIIPVQTSRGCPFDCTFCSVTSMFGRRFRFRSTRHIIRELRQYNSRRNFIFFYDDNFTANPGRAKELLRAMIAEKFKFKWSVQVRADVARDRELVRLMKKAGCHTLFIGFESVNPRSLEAMKKKQTVEEIIRTIRILRRCRIHIHGMFVYGFDDDDWRTVKQTVRFAKRARLNSSQFLILTPLPGSHLYCQIEKEKRFQFKDWNLYDAHHVVFRPARFAPLDLQRAQIFSHKKFYSWMQTVKKFLRLRWLDVGVAHYARKLNRLWQRNNRTFLTAVSLLGPKKNVSVSVDYRENINL